MSDLVDVLVQAALAPFPEDLLKQCSEVGVTLVCLGSVSPRAAVPPTHTPLGMQILRGTGLLPEALNADGSKNASELVDLAVATLSRNEVALLSEAGLDRRPQMPNLETQTAVLERLLRAAQGLGKPSLLHAVRAQGPLVELLDRVQTDRLAVHGFTGSPEAALELTRRGVWVSFGPGLLNAQAKRVKAAAVAVPDELLLVESDAPTYPPSHLTDVLSTLATLRGQEVAELQALTAANARRWLGLKPG